MRSVGRQLTISALAYAGWTYDKQQRILYVKLRYNVKPESIRILHHSPENSGFVAREEG